MNNSELALDQELNLSELEDVNGAWIFPALRLIGFAVATYRGCKEIEQTQKTGELPCRFTDVPAKYQDQNGTNYRDNGDGKGCIDPNFPF